jgi:glycerol-3-phosphate dehydrogenase (NAD(P)+)
MPDRIAVFGAGSWGTALAWLLGSQGRSVALWCRREEQAAAIRAAGTNDRYLPGLHLPPCIAATSDVGAASEGTSLAVLALPTTALRGLARRLRDLLPAGCAVVLACKGLEPDTGLRVSEIALSEAGPAWRDCLAVLSGPNLAGELVRQVPTTTVIAAWNADLARRMQAVFAAPFFRAYTNSDVIGVELGGALKNPIAVAAGINDGLAYGQNSKAALITRGLAEMTRLGVACGARPVTFAGLSGLGDLVATCDSPLSRNYRLGRALANGLTLDAALAELGQVAEGVPTASAAVLLAARVGVELPITAELRRVLFEGRSPQTAVAALMAREYRGESGDGP